MSVIINGDTGITTPAETVQGALTTTGNTILGDASTDTLNVGNGGLVKDASGNVGIGTASPSYKLDVQGSVGATIASKTAEFNAAGGSIYSSYNDGTKTWRVGVGIQTAGMFTFRNHTDGTLPVNIDSSGNLLVGTTSTIGSSRFVVAADTTSTNVMAVSNTRSTASTDYSILFYRNGSIVGSVQTTLSATSYVTSSDYRLKQNIAPMTGALSKVALLKPVTYKWKNTGENGQGFIAHELAEVCPDAVAGEKDAVDADGNPKYQGIDTSFLVATLTAAIQEQQALIIQLQADVAALKALSA